MSKLNEFRKRCSEEGIKFLDLKAIDLRGTLHHLTIPVGQVSEDVLVNGVGFDGSSYGFAKTENSDMVLIPDLNTAKIDPFRSATTLSCYCSIHLANDDRDRFADDTRNVANKAEDLLKTLGIADKSHWGPEFEFNIFEDVEFDNKPEESYFSVESRPAGNSNAYHACNPSDQYADFRDRAVEIIEEQGIDVRYHHHEVGTFGQQEIEMTFNDILTSADNAVTVKYILKNLAEREAVALTFMPKPVYGQAGNGWHCHQFLTKAGKNIFHDAAGYSNLSKTALNYLGGILKHGPAIMAFTNPSTNSYKRLVPGYEAPTALTFGRANRAGAIRIPKYVNDAALTRIEYRPPDATSNPYLCMAAMLMAGIDGIVNEIDPTAEGFGPYDTDASKDKETAEKVQFLPRTLYGALDALEADNEFLKRDGVFGESLINRWLQIKREEVRQYLLRPHPYEYEYYFDF